MKRFGLPPAIWLVAILLAHASLAQAGEAHARAKGFLRREGDRLRLALVIEIAKGWKLYHAELGSPDAVGKPTVVTFGDAAEWAPVRWPRPFRLAQPGVTPGGGDTWIHAHEGRIVLYASGRVVRSEAEAIAVTIDGLTCGENMLCVPYRRTLRVPLSGREGEDALFAAFPPDSAATEKTPAPDLAVPAGRLRGLPRYLLLAFLAGLLLNVMPCVLPVVSIRVLGLLEQTGQDNRRAVVLGLAMSAGIVAVFLGLGVLAVAANLGWGEQFSSRAFLVIMVAVVFALALSLLGVFEIAVPVGFSRTGGGGGLGYNFFMGALATLLATPCAGPFLGTALVWAARQPATVTLLVFLVMGLGMASPYLLLTARPAWLERVPRPGAWMQTFKQAMGFVLMLTVVYLMYPLHRDGKLFFATVFFLTSVALGCWLWGRFASPAARPAVRARVFLLAALVVALGAGFSFRVLPAWMAPRGEWQPYAADRFAQALAAERNVVLKFHADWCSNCKVNDYRIFRDEEILARLRARDTVLLEADLTLADARTDRLREVMRGFGGEALPFTVFVPGGRREAAEVRSGLLSRADVTEVVDRFPARGK